MNTSTLTQSSIERALTRARDVQPLWAAMSVDRRIKLIRRARHLLAKRCGKIAAAADGPITETLSAQVLPLADACRFLEKNARTILAPQRLGRHGRPLWLRGVDSEVVREPMGVVLIITPANYPLFIPGTQLFQALAAGNAVLLKPGRRGDTAAAELRNVCSEAGIDQRLVAILPSTDAAAAEALDLPIDKVFFTGSSETGRQLLARLAPRVIPAVVELSGCDAAIVRADADIRLVANALCFGLRFNNSATCIAPRRVLVARARLEQLEAELVANIHINAERQGDELLRNAIRAALAAGATSLVGGVDLSGALQMPCVLTDVRPEMPIARLDAFAPVLSIIAVDNDDDAIAIANDSRFALGASVFTRDQATARGLAARLNAGVVTINDVIVPTADPRIPFGGRKQSGFGVTRGAEGLLAMTKTKVIQLRRGRNRPHLDHRLTNRSATLLAGFIQVMHAGRLIDRLGGLKRLLLGVGK